MFTFATEVIITMMAAGSRAVFGAHIVGSIPTVIITLFLYIYLHPNYIVVLHLL